MTQTTRYVYAFADGDGRNKQLLGGKGANLCEMTQIGLNVPPGFVISTEACRAFLQSPDATLPPQLMEQVRVEMRKLEQATGKRFGGQDNPLLVSVRSGSALSMPGMMDTILNLGLNHETLTGLVGQTNDERFALDAYRRFIQLFGKVALGVSEALLDEQLESVKERVGVHDDVSLSANHLHEVVERLLDAVRVETGPPFPADPYQQ
ncbi:MAG: pyruvate phosphate dikinase, partial [Gammaproteobacteria bacterium SG8_47]